MQRSAGLYELARVGFDFAISFACNLSFLSGQLVCWLDTARNAVQADIVVVINDTGDSLFCNFVSS